MNTIYLFFGSMKFVRFYSVVWEDNFVFIGNKTELIICLLICTKYFNVKATPACSSTPTRLSHCTEPLRRFRTITTGSYKRWKSPCVFRPRLTDTLPSSSARGRDFHPHIQILLWPPTGERLFTLRPLTSVFSLLKFISNPKTERLPPGGDSKMTSPRR